MSIQGSMWLEVLDVFVPGMLEHVLVFVALEDHIQVGNTYVRIDWRWLGKENQNSLVLHVIVKIFCSFYSEDFE